MPDPAGAGRYALFVAAEDRLAAVTALGLDATSPAGEAAGVSRSCPACEAAVAPGELECPDCGLVVGDEPEQPS